MAPSTTTRKAAGLGVLAAALLSTSLQAQGELDQARDFLRRQQPDKAAAMVQQLLKRQADDPWLLYNLGVTAYAAKNYAEADRLWQDLATTQLARSLWKPVWTQIGNAAFRLGEPHYDSAPEQTVQLWERSCEAYRIVLSESPRHKVAQPNLELVEAKLAQLKIRLADELVTKAQKQSLEPKIESLQAALDYYQAARELTPEDRQLPSKISQTDRQLRGSLNEFAEKQEKQGDQSFAARNAWSDRQAEKQYQEALSHFERAAFQDPETVSPPAAPAPSPQNSSAQANPPAPKPASDPTGAHPPSENPEIQRAEQGGERVTDKLADLYARMGRQHQQEAGNQAKYSPERAVENYHEALEDFGQALALEPEHTDAQRGEQEVKAALEQLHMEQGRQEMRAGMNQLQQNNQMRAATELQEALTDFREAQALNPQNPEAQTSIEQIQKILPELLTALGQRARQQAAQAEPKSAPDAVEHLERAEASFDRALQVQPEHQPAQAGLEQTQADLHRLRQQIAAQLEQQAQQRQQQQQSAQQPNSPSRSPQSQPFDEMLADLNPEEAQRQYEQDRLRGTGRDRPNQRKHVKTW